MKISIITVSFNSAETIQTTLSSVESQTYSNFEYIIIDGGSKDSTLDIVHSYPDLITKCVSERDAGIYDAMNKGIQLANGEIIGILNSDDFYCNDRVLQEVSDLFASDPQLEVVLGDVDYVKGEDLSCPVRKYRSRNFKPWMFRFGLMPPHPAIFVRKSAYDRVGLYKLGYRIAADFDFLVRLLLLDSAKYRVANTYWVRMRVGGVSTRSLGSNSISTKEMKRALEDNGVFASEWMLMLRLPFKFITQVLCG